MKGKPERSYLPIENYGIIGNLSTAALVSLDGSVDFMCYPRFDSPTIFCRLLDAHKGGYFSISPQMENIVQKQLYIPDTNVLVTRFFSDEGIAELIDFMPVHDGDECTLIRKIKTVRGRIPISVRCAPRFHYAASLPIIETYRDGLLFSPGQDGQPSLVLHSDNPLHTQDHHAFADLVLEEDASACFILTTNKKLDPGTSGWSGHIERAYHTTINYWQSWIRKTTYEGHWQEEVRRSALTLKLLVCDRHGSMVAAPTFSLPEAIGFARNWDYRYTWIRDAAFAMHAFLQLGFSEEAKRFLEWTMKQSTEKELQLMFGIDGETEIPEKILTHLEGYRKSKPVRIGNDAFRQEQVDIYGELLETVYLYTTHGGELTFEYWTIITEYINWVIANWKTADHSLWEVRGPKREFLFSRLMCWVAMDRAIKIGTQFSYPFDMVEWHRIRDEIFYDIYENFWNAENQAFVQYKGGTELDAGALLMPILRFLSPASEKWQKTMAAIDRELRSDVLVYRYREQGTEVDGMKGMEGTFTMCSFWHVECLALMGQVEKAKEHFEKMLGYANHLGLFSEQIGMKGEHLGNFPQAFTHLALISAAVQLDYNNKGGKRNPPVY